MAGDASLKVIQGTLSITKLIVSTTPFSVVVARRNGWVLPLFSLQALLRS